MNKLNATLNTNPTQLRSTFKASYPLHALCEVFPWMERPDLSRLAEDTKANGQREPILIKDGKIIDGKNRELACFLAGVEPTYKDVDVAKEDLPAFVMSLNWHRRHLSESQRAQIAAKLVPVLAKQWEEVKTQTSRKFANNTKTQAKTQAAGMMNVSPRSVDDALVVEEKGTPEVRAAVASGKLAISAAAHQSRSSRATPPVEFPEILSKIRLAAYEALDKVTNFSAGFQKPLRERIDDLFMQPEWTEEAAAESITLSEKLETLLKAERGILSSRLKSLNKAIKTVEQKIEEINKGQLPLLGIFNKPSNFDWNVLKWKPKPVKAEKTKPVKDAQANGKEQKAG